MTEEEKKRRRNLILDADFRQRSHRVQVRRNTPPSGQFQRRGARLSDDATSRRREKRERGDIRRGSDANVFDELAVDFLRRATGG